MTIAFMIIMTAKTIAFDISITGNIKRYYVTYKKFNQAEIWLLLLTVFKVTIVLPNYFYREINWLYYVFVINSFTTFYLSHILHMRGCII